MADANPPGGTTPETGTGPAPDNAAFAKMRTDLAAAQAARTELEEKLKTAERARMDELERTKAELAETAKREQALKARDEQAKQYEGAFEALYKDELAALPDDKRDRVAKLTAAGTWPERLSALREARALLGAPPVVAGTSTQPPAGGTPADQTPPTGDGRPPQGPQPLTKDQLRNTSFGDILAARPAGAETVIPAAQVESLMKRIEATIEQKLGQRK